jgi:hypothetical protein
VGEDYVHEFIYGEQGFRDKINGNGVEVNIKPVVLV